MSVIAAALPNETILVARAAAEPAAFAALYDHYFPRVYNYVRYRVGSREIADDLVAEVFERVLSRIGTYQPDRAPFAAWLFAIAHNVVNDHLRAQRRRRWLSLDALREWASGQPQPEEATIHNETRTELLSALGCLDERERDLIALKFAAGLTNRRIAELVNLSESNVGVILYRAVRRLRVELGAEGPSHE